MELKKDTFRAVLTNSNDLRDGGTLSEPIFNLKFNGKQSNYEYVELFVDNFVIDTINLTISSYNVRADLYQPNSISSYSIGGSSDILASIVSPNKTASRTIDLGLSYQNPNAPIQISSIPDKIRVFLTKGTGEDGIINLETNNNIYVLTLRFNAYYK